ncbi:MAG: amidohydrolase family protein [Ruminococcus callidus]
MKNGYRITDAHAHVFPDKIAEKATEGISHFYDLPMQYHGRVAEMLENGTAAVIDHFLVCSPATTVTQVHSINSFLASCAAAYPMCTAFGTLHPYAENVEADFQQLRSLQLRGVKLHPDFQNFPIDDPRAYPMYEMIQSSGLPILMQWVMQVRLFPPVPAGNGVATVPETAADCSPLRRMGTVERGNAISSRMSGCGLIPAAACRSCRRRRSERISFRR